MTMPVAETCHIVRVGEDGDEDGLDRLGLDLWDATEEAERIFKREGIRISSIENVVFAAVCDGHVVGAATIGSTPHHFDRNAREYTFSVAVDRKWQRRQLGRKLVEAVLHEAKSQEIPGEYRVWVVNPNMARLLESLGFEPEGREWTEDTPHMQRGLVRGQSRGPLRMVARGGHRKLRVR